MSSKVEPIEKQQLVEHGDHDMKDVSIYFHFPSFKPSLKR